MKDDEIVDWTEYYKVLGEFVVNFENIVFDIREDCNHLLKSQGLKDSTIGEIVFGQKFFTADPLINCYVSMINHLIKRIDRNSDLVGRLNNFKKSFTKLIECRNDILHSTHFHVESIILVGPPEMKSVKEFKAFKPSPKKTGYDLKRTPRPQIITYSNELKQMRKDLRAIKVDLHKLIKAGQH